MTTPDMKSVAYDYIYQREQSGWWYRVRRELVRKLLARYARNARDILEIGCGAGLLLKELSDAGLQCTGLDVDSRAVAYSQSRGISHVILGTATALSFQDDTFDVIIALDVLEHIEDAKAATREMYRVLRKDGVAIIFVPALQLLWSGQDVITGHFRRYDKKSLLADIDSRFTVLRQSYFNFIFFLPIWLGKHLVRNLYDDSAMYLNNPVVDFIAYHIFRMEIPFLKYFSFPFGVSRFIVVKK